LRRIEAEEALGVVEKVERKVKEVTLLSSRRITVLSCRVC